MGNVLISPTCGGHFEGEEKGNVIPVGALYTTSNKACVSELDLTVLLETEREEHLLMKFQGILTTTPEIEEKFARQEDDVDLSQIYAGGTAEFFSDAERLKCYELKKYLCTFRTEGWDNFIIQVFEPEM